jgi:hypothetical protein
MASWRYSMHHRPHTLYSLHSLYSLCGFVQALANGMRKASYKPGEEMITQVLSIDCTCCTPSHRPLSLSLSVSHSLSLSLSLSLSFLLSVSLSISLSIFLTLCLSICLSLSHSLSHSLCLSLSLSHSLCLSLSHYTPRAMLQSTHSLFATGWWRWCCATGTQTGRGRKQEWQCCGRGSTWVSTFY